MEANKRTGTRWMLWAAAFVTPLLLVGCKAKSRPVAPDDPYQNPHDVPVTVSQPHDRGFNAPPHVFTPRQHPPRNRPPPPSPPNLQSLPRLVDRVDQCSGRPSRNRSPIASNSTSTGRRRPGSSSSGSSSRHVPYQPSAKGGGAASSSPKRPKPKRSPNKKTSRPRADDAPTAETFAPPADPMGATAGADMGPPPPASAPAADRAKDVASKRDSRQQRRQERKRRREAEKSASALDATMAAEEAGEDDFDQSELQLAAPEPEPAPDPDDQYEDWGAAVYLSNDDTMSLSSAQRVLYAIDNFLPLPLEHIRPHELLNYFSFETDPVQPQDDFSVRTEIAPVKEDPGIYTMAMAVRGRPLDIRSRRNANLSFVIDRSGSMSDEGRMDYLRRGLQRMVSELKTGDIVNIVLFDHAVCNSVENFVVGRDSPDVLRRAIGSLQPRGSTDIHSGLTSGFQLADRAYQPTYTNRVILITDALTNTGVTDERMISMIGDYYDRRRIRLSGVGVGSEFNDSLLDRLTERGKGAYVFLGSEAEVDAVFGQRFVSLIETTATDVHFRVHLPPSLRMNVFYGEESSVVKEDVQAIHYFANTSQLFLSDVMARGGAIRPQDSVMFTIEYEDPETGQKMVEEQAWSIGDIQQESLNVRKGRLLMRWADGLAEMAMRPLPTGFGRSQGSWSDESGWQRCENIRVELRDMSVGLSDPEVRHVTSLWDKFCARYERPRNPVRRTPGQKDSWPGARG